MNQKIISAIDSLVQALREESSESMVAFHLFVNSAEHTVDVSHQTPEPLNRPRISMRNLRGNFIR